MVRTKVTYYKMLTPERWVEMCVVQAWCTARIAVALPLNSPEEAMKEEEASEQHAILESIQSELGVGRTAALSTRPT